ncbi:hypothetical protein [Oryza sativa Japonica Group]|uniref:Uncharacterized protein n=1 Tax=Oryza sativa subsp. japonica TaxID=39947 RepID=Q5NBL9_ORYSJ|nr:hypothetical protein [Oryza sativa Japonica Group]
MGREHGNNAERAWGWEWWRWRLGTAVATVLNELGDGDGGGGGMRGQRIVWQLLKGHRIGW